MNDFKRTLIVLAAVSTFGSGTYVGLSGVSAILDSRVATVLDSRQAAEAKSATSGIVDSITERVQKSLSSLFK